MEGQLNLDCERFQQITQMAKMGWWESDVKNQQYISCFLDLSLIY